MHKQEMKAKVELTFWLSVEGVSQYTEPGQQNQESTDSKNLRKFLSSYYTTKLMKWRSQLAYITNKSDFTKTVLKVTKQKPVTKCGERTNFWSCNIIFNVNFQENIKYEEAKPGSYTEGKKSNKNFLRRHRLYIYSTITLNKLLYV